MNLKTHPGFLICDVEVNLNSFSYKPEQYPPTP
jgi:hypothetical protein